MRFGPVGVGDNLAFYWTRVDSSFTVANLIGGDTLPADLSKGATDFYVGSSGRLPYRVETDIIDEVRISAVARGADEFIFGVPEPSTLVLTSLALLGLIAHRRRKRA